MAQRPPRLSLYSGPGPNLPGFRPESPSESGAEEPTLQLQVDNN